MLEETPKSSSPPLESADRATADSLSIYPAVSFAVISAPTNQLYGLQPAAPNPSVPSQSRGLAIQSILNAPSEPDHTIFGGTTPTPEVSDGQHLLPTATVSPRNHQLGEPAPPSHIQPATAAESTDRRSLIQSSQAPRPASLVDRKNCTFYATGLSPQMSIDPWPRMWTTEPGGIEVPFLPSLSTMSLPTAPSFQSTKLPPNNGRHRLQPIGTPYSASFTDMTQSASPCMTLLSLTPKQHDSHDNRHDATSGTLRPAMGHRSQESVVDSGYTPDEGDIAVPVVTGLHQAPKLAEEKRKRNAGASARFRARRRKREIESSQRIAILQQELQELREERDFYHNERNYIRDFTTRNVRAYLPSRPPSPLFHGRRRKRP